LSRAYLPRDGAACYVLRDPPVSPPTTPLDCPCACMLCGDEGSGERLVAVRRCGHVLCGDCVASHAKARVESHPGNPVRTHMPEASGVCGPTCLRVSFSRLNNPLQSQSGTHSFRVMRAVSAGDVSAVSRQDRLGADHDAAAGPGARGTHVHPPHRHPKVRFYISFCM
jgi:hypothetical protein